MATTSFTQITVWQKAHQAALSVHRLTRTFPDFERVELGRQMRRAAMSIPSNIAEGFGRRRPLDKAYFYTVATGSLEEVRYGLIFARDLGYLQPDSPLFPAMDEIGRMLRRLVETTERRAAFPTSPPRSAAGASSPPSPEGARSRPSLDS